MKILLTGANGQVGWELAKLLPSLGEVTALGRDQLDLSDEIALRTLIRRQRPELIVNAAAYTAVDRAQTEQDLAWRVNAHAVQVMAEEARTSNALLVHYSTDYVFDGSTCAPMREDDPVSPLNVYGHTKLAGEEALRASGVPYLNFRTSWVYGARGKNFMLTVLRLAAERPELSMVADQIGAPTWCRYLAMTTHRVLEHFVRARGTGAAWPRSQCGTYHMSAAGATSWHGFAEEILRVRFAGDARARPSLRAIAAREYPLPARRPRYSMLNNEKLVRTFNVETLSWIEQLHRCMAELPR